MHDKMYEFRIIFTKFHTLASIEKFQISVVNLTLVGQGKRVLVLVIRRVSFDADKNVVKKCNTKQKI